MDNFWTELGTALTPILTSLISVLVAFLIRLINIKVTELKGKVDDKTEYKYIEMISNTVTKCVTEINQTYVENLKDKNMFTAAAQKEAFNNCLKSIENLLPDECKKYITETYKDLEAYLKVQIEAEVNKQKMPRGGSND